MSSLKNKVPTKVVVRDGLDGVRSFDLQCRFTDEQKFDAIQVSRDCELLAHVIAAVLNNRDTTVNQILKTLEES